MLELLASLAVAFAPMAAESATLVTATAGGQDTLVVTQGRLVLLDPARVAVRVRNDGATPVRVISIAVAGGVGEPRVSVRGPSGQTGLPDGRIPVQSGLAEGEMVVLEAEVEIGSISISGTVPASIHFEGGRVIRTELVPSIPILPTRPEDRVEGAVPPPAAR